MPQNDGIANILGALGAGMKGQGLQYQQMQFAEQERQRQIGLQQQQMKQQQDAERARTAFTDAAAGLSRAKAGDFEGVFNLANHRFGLLQSNHPEVDNTKTGQILELSGRAAQGDKQAQTQLISELQDAVNIGQDTGILPPNPKRELKETKDGRATFLNPDGTVSEEAIIGAVQGGKKMKLSDFRSINKDVGALIKEPLKIRNAASRLSKIAKTKSPTDQLAAIFTFMKALDPTSVVREGEQQQARSTGGPVDQLIGFINKIKGEGALPESVFKNMVLTAKRISNQASTDSNSQVSGFLDAFGDRVRDKDKERLLQRSPKLFDMPAASTAGFKIVR